MARQDSKKKIKPFAVFRNTLTSRQQDGLDDVLPLNEETERKQSFLGLAGDYIVLEKDYPTNSEVPLSRNQRRDMHRDNFHFDDGKVAWYFPAQALDSRVYDYFQTYAKNITHGHQPTEVFLKTMLSQSLVLSLVGDYIKDCRSFAHHCGEAECKEDVSTSVNFPVPGVEHNNHFYIERIDQKVVVHLVSMHHAFLLEYLCGVDIQSYIEAHKDVVLHLKLILTPNGPDKLNVKVELDTILYLSVNGSIKEFALYLLLNHQQPSFKRLFGGIVSGDLSDLPVLIENQQITSVASTIVSFASIKGGDYKNGLFQNKKYPLCSQYERECLSYALGFYAMNRLWPELLFNQYQRQKPSDYALLEHITTRLRDFILLWYSIYSQKSALYQEQLPDCSGSSNHLLKNLKHRRDVCSKERRALENFINKVKELSRKILSPANGFDLLKRLEKYMNTSYKINAGIFSAWECRLIVANHFPLASLLDYLRYDVVLADCFLDVRGSSQTAMGNEPMQLIEQWVEEQRTRLDEMELIQVRTNSLFFLNKAVTGVIANTTQLLTCKDQFAEKISDDLQTSGSALSPS